MQNKVFTTHIWIKRNSFNNLIRVFFVVYGLSLTLSQSLTLKITDPRSLTLWKHRNNHTYSNFIWNKPINMCICFDFMGESSFSLIDQQNSWDRVINAFMEGLAKNWLTTFTLVFLSLFDCSPSASSGVFMCFARLQMSWCSRMKF